MFTAPALKWYVTSNIHNPHWKSFRWEICDISRLFTHFSQPFPALVQTTSFPGFSPTRPHGARGSSSLSLAPWGRVGENPGNEVVVQNLTFFCLLEVGSSVLTSGGPKEGARRWGGGALPYFWIRMRPEGSKNSFWDRTPLIPGSGWAPPPPPKVWIRNCWWLTIGLKLFATVCPFYRIKAPSTRTQIDLKMDFYFPFRFSFLFSRKRRIIVFVWTNAKKKETSCFLLFLPRSPCISERIIVLSCKHNERQVFPPVNLAKRGLGSLRVNACCGLSLYHDSTTPHHPFT